MNKAFLVLIALLIWFAYMDVWQITSFFEIGTQEGWDLYNQYTGPAIWTTWYVVMLALGAFWYIFTKDKSEALAITLGGAALIWFGTQDLFYFFFSGQTLDAVGCWASGMPPIQFISQMLGEECPTRTSFVLSGTLGIIVSYFLYKYLQKAKW